MSVSEHLVEAKRIAERAQSSTRKMRTASGAQKNEALIQIARALENDEVQQEILRANQKDIDAAIERNLSAPMVDRLRLDAERLMNIASSVKEVAALDDPVGVIERMQQQKSGISVGRMNVPLGVVLIVYESRPNVTIDAAVLCLKSGNAVILRGGREAAFSNRAFEAVINKALADTGLHEDAVTLVKESDRELLYALLKQSEHIDLAIPRGGTSLIDAVNEHAKVPVIQHYQGICHLYVHKSADLNMAARLIVNAKVQRPGVCNALEGFVTDESVAEAFLPKVFEALHAHGVEVRGCSKSLKHADMKAASDADFHTEFLAKICTSKVVSGLDEALNFIEQTSSGHTEAICTNDHSVAMRYLREVDASCVLINASTRFNDGGELGLGAELGISTTKLHAYGPMGLNELCAKKFVVMGQGQTRGTP